MKTKKELTEEEEKKIKEDELKKDKTMTKEKDSEGKTIYKLKD